MFFKTKNKKIVLLNTLNMTTFILRYVLQNGNFYKKSTNCFKLSSLLNLTLFSFRKVSKFCAMNYKNMSMMLLLIFMFDILCAQTPSDSCIDLRNPVYTFEQIDSITNIPYAGNHPVLDYYSNADTLSGKSCNSDSGCDNSNSALVYDVYFPAVAVYHYNERPLPFVVLFHGGGFSDCSTKDGNDSHTYCKTLARRGFVVFNVEYRRGRLKDGNNISPEQLLAAYRGVQDGRGAIRSIIKRQLKNETSFKIDTSQLYIGGNSAGAIMSLHIAFCDQQEMDEAFPRISDASILGPIDKGDYYGSPDIAFSVKGVLSMWGALAGTSNDTGFPSCIKETDRIPVIAFHGELDKVVPCFVAKGNFSGGERATVSQCGITYQLTSDSGFAYWYGDAPVYERLKSLNIPVQLYLDSDARHGLSRNADYGVTDDVMSLEEYIATRAAIFFQAIHNKISFEFLQGRFEDIINNKSYCEGNESQKYKR